MHFLGKTLLVFALLHSNPLRKFGITQVLACTYQAISGAGKTFERWPEMIDNLIPYIGGEEEKSEQEPLKIWGTIENGEIVKAKSPLITTQCLRVPVSDGHTAAVFVKFKNKPTEDEIKAAWAEYKGIPQELELPHAPKQFLNYFEEPDRPQARIDRNLEGGMAISIGRLREDTLFDYKFVCLSHNTLRGAAGGAVELAELLGSTRKFEFLRNALEFLPELEYLFLGGLVLEAYEYSSCVAIRNRYTETLCRDRRC